MTTLQYERTHAVETAEPDFELVEIEDIEDGDHISLRGASPHQNYWPLVIRDTFNTVCHVVKDAGSKKKVCLLMSEYSCSKKILTIPTFPFG